MEDDHDAELYAMQLATASVLPMAMKTAIELGVFDVITSAGPAASLSPAQIASQLAASTTDSSSSASADDVGQRLDPILHLLASHSVLTSSPRNVDHGGGGGDGDGFQRSYGLAPVAKYFLKDGNKTGMHLKDSVVEGGTPFNRAYRMDGMEFMRGNPRFREVFAGSITEFSPIVMEAFLERYCEEGFAGVKSLVDVGGGDGSSSRAIVSRVSTIRNAINFDLPFVVQNAPSYPGVEHVGDMFESVPKGDVIFMKWILHLWDDEQCVKIFRNCYQATPENGKVVIVDALIPETSETSAAAAAKASLMFNLYRMSMKPQGKERTLSQFDSLAKQAGFSHARIACFAYNFAVVEFLKSI
ncbi:unnamed protein product [Linum tenue]|uniref:Uncharacterized protein n=1 Tax=Linum tenue TaxID=586396 RepID=A0AAV0IHI1_9ROSI|nr:unnamed protein product [Linum tenue]